MTWAKGMTMPSSMRDVTRRIRVLVVDDSALMRQVLGTLLARDPAIELVGTAGDPYVARDKIRELHPDVLTLDVQMPRMDGLSFLEKLMRVRPMPVVMVSSVTEAGCATTLRALELGAVDFVTKPRCDVRERMTALAEEIIEKIKVASTARVRQRLPGAPVLPYARPAVPPPARNAAQVIAIGASTGGTEALRQFLSALPADAPGVVVVQHMPASFTRAFAERLDHLCTIRVKEASDGDTVLAGHALIAPGDQHMRLARDNGSYRVRVTADPPVNRHRPAVDVLFHSCAELVRGNAVGVLMTGMGDDGARGLLAMRKAGARTFAQDEESCVVFGMPKVALDMGAVDDVLPLSRLADAALGGIRGRA
jgi:two-component system, chemotaxis family, protein-glutamate methylesterase/glutaminase